MAVTKIAAPGARYLNLKQAGIYLGGKSWVSVKNLINTGVIPACKLGSRIYIDIRDIDAAMANSKARRSQKAVIEA